MRTSLEEAHMARKKPTPPSDEGPKRRSRSESKRIAGPSEVSGEIPAKSSDVPPAPKRQRPRAIDPKLELARDLVNQAAKALDPKRRIALAKQAIKTHHDCAEAYLLMAEIARSRKE